MSVYANKFVIELNDIARIVFIDERMPISKGLPSSSSTMADVVMTRTNLQSLHDAIGTLLEKFSPE